MRLPELLLASLLMVGGTNASSTNVGSAPAFAVGVWELTGVGEDNDLVRPEGVILEFTPTGEFRLFIPEDGDFGSFETRGRYAMRDGRLELTAPDSGPPQLYQVTFDASVMELQEIEEPLAPAMRFVRRAWSP